MVRGAGCPPAPPHPRQIAVFASLILANPWALGARTPHRLQETAKIKGKSWGGRPKRPWGELGQGGVRVCEETSREMGTWNKIK